MTTQAGLFDAPQPAAPAVEMADGAERDAGICLPPADGDCGSAQ